MHYYQVTVMLYANFRIHLPNRIHTDRNEMLETGKQRGTFFRRRSTTLRIEKCNASESKIDTGLYCIQVSVPNKMLSIRYQQNRVFTMTTRCLKASDNDD